MSQNYWATMLVLEQSAFLTNLGYEAIIWCPSPPIFKTVPLRASVCKVPVWPFIPSMLKIGVPTVTSSHTPSATAAGHGEGAPLASSPQRIEDPVDELAPTPAGRAATVLDGGYQGLQDCPLGVAQVTGIALP